MTLVKAKPKRPTTAHRRRIGEHHRHSHDYVKTYWPYLPVVTVLTFGVCLNGWLSQAGRSVLGYATDMSIQSLLDDTNTQRTQNQETSLMLNANLDQAAQAKADDMATRDYWSHNTPDGRTPWSFITAAGYNYQTAGENLAYGFATAADTLTGWMNSPEHRANILNSSFKDVGFGIVNIVNYQGSGPETLVVAMYGSPATAQVVAAAPQTTTPKLEPAPKPQAQPTSSPLTVTQPPQASQTQPASTSPQQPNQNPATLTASPRLAEPSQERITRFQLVSSNTPMNSLALSMFGAAAFGLFVLRNGLAWRKVLIKSEGFILRHPMLDVSLASLASLSLVLCHTVGIIR